MNGMLISDTHYGHSRKTHRIHEKFLKDLAAAIKEHDVKFLVHAGDWISNQQHQFWRTMRMIRGCTDIPILAVRGNHDLWDVVSPSKRPQWSWSMMNEQHKKWFKEYNIHHLEDGPFAIDDVIVVGFDGWYYHMNAPTHDAEMMIKNIDGVPAMLYHEKRAHNALDRVLNTDTSQYRKAVCVTHFPPFTEDPYYLTYCANPKYFDFIKEKFDVFCTGHSHHYWNEVQDDCLILNCGPDYDKPTFLIFEV